MELRTVLIGLVVVLCIYIAWLAMGWRRAKRKVRSVGVNEDKHANVFRDVDRFGAIAIGGQTGAHPADVPILLPEDDDSVVSLSTQSSDAEPNVRTPRPSEPDASGFGFDALLEVRQMRHMVDDLRSQQARMSEDILRLRNELMALRAASRVAPAYAEAVSMVERGLDAQAIAERCGISVAEAELVRALSEQRGQDEDESPQQAQEQTWQHDGNHNKTGGQP